ncbi:hypothetical protein GTO27_03720 [Candidatus Bathyarchaeota archaeon]|nr:hypothetical protein [Candidatus Bathyarchaeota archaeon]
MDLTEEHILEFISRETKEVLKSVKVKEDPRIEEKIWSYVYEAKDRST